MQHFPFFNGHTHTDYSNIRLIDCINKIEPLINKAVELGLSGIAITDHECLSGHIEANNYAEKIRKDNPNFKVALGNEIYLTDTRDKGQKFYHFILIAKDAIGHKALRELSSIAWYNLYKDRAMERVPTLKNELSEIVKKYPGHLIATTACLGGELSTLIMNLTNAEKAKDEETSKKYHNQICDFMKFCINLFGEDFYVECAPAGSKDQIIVNKRLYKIAKDFGVKIVPASDAHYLSKEDRFVHKSYLNSKDGEREVDSFYEYSYLMGREEAFKLLMLSFEDEDICNEILNNSNEVYEKIEHYSLKNNQKIPKVEVKDYPAFETETDFTGSYKIEWNFPTIDYLLCSSEIQERYWINKCLTALGEKDLYNTVYLERLETEANVIKHIGEKLNDCLFAYFNTFEHYINLFWECGSIVGPGRGSATGFLSNYLLGITQLDPVKWNLPYWRFLNLERAELPDIDVDLAPSKRPAIMEAIRKERGELGLVQVATFGTEGTKSTILTACRGYRTEEFPSGIDVDTAQYMSSLIPQERGFLWTLKEVVYGDADKDRKPVQEFIRTVNQYEGLLDIMFSIEGLINKRSSHASGVILYDETIYDTAAIMRTPKGALITCYDLHNAEAAGDTKYDFLVTDISDKIIQQIELLQKDNVIEQGSLKEIYDKYYHPEILNTDRQDMWDALADGSVMDVFQFNTGVGLSVAKKTKPQNPLEMTAANAMMRLMSEKGKESQQDRFARIKKYGLESFEREMCEVGLPDEMREAMHHYCDTYYGCCAIQEQMMEILMDKNIAKFTLAEANDARKIVAKKQMSRIPELREKVFNAIEKESWAQYIWDTAVAPQLGYAFSLNHSLPYSFVGLQTIYNAIEFNPIYWDTACLIVNSGATDPDAGSSTNYGKIAKAIGDVKSKGIEVSLVDINNSDFGFSPDIKNNRILFGMKGLLNVGDDVIKDIIANRPYTGLEDFLNKVKSAKKQSVISLIKGGAFDSFGERKFMMALYIWLTCKKTSRVNLQNMSSLIKNNLLPDSLQFQISVYEFNRYLKNQCLQTKDGYYILDDRALSFYDNHYNSNEIEIKNSKMCLGVKVWDKIYQSEMDPARDWIKANSESLMHELNKINFMADWQKYAKGNVSSWEMEVLCFYYHDHELKDTNLNKYGLSNFKDLPEQPMIETIYKRGGREIPIFKLSKIYGTCIAKDKVKGSVSLLTTDGVVEVKFRKEYFSLFDKQISMKQSDGTKKIMEKSWFNRGSMIIVMGVRDGDNFIPKKYASSAGHQLYRIDSILENGDLLLRDERFQGGELEDND